MPSDLDPLETHPGFVPFIIWGNDSFAQVYIKEAESELVQVNGHLSNQGSNVGPVQTWVCPSSPTSMFRGLGVIARVLPTLAGWIVLLLTLRAYGKLGSGRKEAVLKAVRGLLERTGQAAR